MAKHLRWGILGTGQIAGLMTADLQLHGSPVVAVGSRAQSTADEFASRFGIPAAYDSYEALVNDANVDVVYVATPHPSHAGDARRAISAGKHVLVEKSFALNAAEARSVAALAAEAGVVVLEAMWTRWLPHMVRLREIISAGTLGEVRTVLADHNQAIRVDPDHRILNPKLGGGALLDLGIYPVSFAWDIFGAPTRVVAMSSATVTGVDRQTAIMLGYPDGQHAVLQTALDTFGPNTAVVLGTDARVEIDSVWYMPTTMRVIDHRGSLLEEFDGRTEGRGMQFQAAELERIVASGNRDGDILPLSESVAIIATLDDIRTQIGLRYPSEV